MDCTGTLRWKTRWHRKELRGGGACGSIIGVGARAQRIVGQLTEKISASFGMEAADRSMRRGSLTHRLSLVRQKLLRGMLELAPLEDRLAGRVGRTPLGCTRRLHGTPRRIGVVTGR